MSRAARMSGGLLSTLLVSACVATVSASASQGAQAPTAQRLASLKHAADAFTSPDSASALLETVSATRPITREQTVLPVLATAVDATGATWLDVLLPGRPEQPRRVDLGRVGHPDGRPVDAHDSDLDSPGHRPPRRPRGPQIQGRRRQVVHADSRRPLLRRGEHQADGRAVGAPYALALSARSNVLQEFAGGPGQIALHGTNNVGGILGTAVSHGCIRLDTPAITWLADHIPPGTPVRILP